MTPRTWATSSGASIPLVQQGPHRRAQLICIRTYNDLNNITLEDNTKGASSSQTLLVNLSRVQHFHAQPRDAIFDLLDILGASKCR